MHGETVKFESLVMYLVSLPTHANVTHLTSESFLFSTRLDFLVFCLMYLGCWYDTGYCVPYSGLFVILFLLFCGISKIITHLLYGRWEDMLAIGVAFRKMETCKLPGYEYFV
jgi:hypothetical protein